MLLNEEAYIELSKESMEHCLHRFGNVQTSTEEVTFAGESHYCVRLEGEYSGLKMYETLVAMKCNGYMACVTVCTWGEDSTGEILDCFYGL